MKDEINALIKDMYDILVLALEIREYARKYQLEVEKTTEELENLANKIKDFVEEYNRTNQTSTSFIVDVTTMGWRPKQEDFYSHSYPAIKIRWMNWRKR